MMRQSFSYILLITWIFLNYSCTTGYISHSVRSSNISVDGSVIPVDDRIVTVYLPYKAEIEKDMSRVIGITTAEMMKDKPESSLTNFLGDLLLQEGKETARDLGQEIEPEISFYNYGGIRTFLPEGEITVGKIFELMPFENEMVFLKLSGSQIKEFFNYVAKTGGQSIGGARFKISGDVAVNAEVGGKPLDESKFYWLVTNDYVAAGGDDLVMFLNNSGYISANKKIRDVIIEYFEKEFKAGRVVKSEPDGRIAYE